jgi:hypothetical protein
MDSSRKDTKSPRHEQPNHLKSVSNLPLSGPVCIIDYFLLPINFALTQPGKYHLPDNWPLMLVSGA